MLANDRRTGRRGKIYPMATLALVLMALVGCQGDATDSPGERPSAEASTSTVPPTYEKFQVPNQALVGQVEGHMSRKRALRLLQVKPILLRGPAASYTSCVYYPMPASELTSLLQLCFRRTGVQFILTAFGYPESQPPPGASQARIAMIGRGDSDCSAQNDLLTAITADVGAALTAYSEDSTGPAKADLVKQLGRFGANLAETRDILAAFVAPPEKADVLADFIGALGEQVDALGDAKEAIAADDLDAYQAAGDQINELETEANAYAKEYGFGICQAASFK